LTIKLTPYIYWSLLFALLLPCAFSIARQIFSCQTSDPERPAFGGPPENSPRPIGREGWRLESSTSQRQPGRRISSGDPRADK